MTTDVVGSCPLDCPDACSWVVTVDEGRAVKLRGNADHQFTQGGLCKKVNPWLDYARDPGRLLEPMRRVGPKGEGRFEPIGWHEAMTEIADRLTAVIERHGGAGVWPFVGTGNLGWIQGSNGRGRIWNRMGASGHNLSICSVAGREGIGYSVGRGDWLDPEDFVNAGLVLIWGSNTLITNRHLWPFVEHARAAGAPLVVVDPIRSRTAAAADIHLAPRPGSDGALALGMMHAIVARGGADELFLTERTLGWSDFRDTLDDWNLARTETITGVAAGDIDRVAAAIVDAPPLAVRIGHGVQRQSFGGQAMRVVSCLPAVVGAYDRLGGGSLYSSTGTPKGLNLDRSQRPELGSRARTLTMTNLGRNLTELDDPPVEALIVYGANPMVSNPQTGLVRQGLERDDLFTVVIDIFATETAAYADVLLPSTMQHEQLEINDSYNHRYLHWNEPAVAPPGQCLPHTEIFRRLATAMGYTEPELFASDEELAADLLDAPSLADAELTPQRLKRDGFAPLPGRPKPHERPFDTPSGRFEFASASAEANGHHRLPTYLAAVEGAAPTGGQLALVAAASDFHVNSTFAGTEVTVGRTTTPIVVLHPDDADERGLADGAPVVIENARGRFEATITISADTRPGVASTTKGWWGQGVNNTVAERDADMGGGAVFHDNTVTITAARATGATRNA